MEKSVGLELDIISELPHNIVEKILVRLPIKDAVRSSVLSSKWRYKWTSIPELIFTDSFCPVSQYESLKFAMFVFRVLCFQSGPIQKFEFSTRNWQNSCVVCLETSGAIDSWMQILCGKYVKELKFQFPDNHKLYKFPSPLFSCEKLTSLNLFHCILKPPATFQGFRSLKTLQLEDISLPEKLFENMISNSILEHLKLVNIKYHNLLEIRAPNLKYFYFDGYFSDLCFKDVPHLTYVYVDLDHIIESGKRFKHQESFHFVNALGCLTGIEKVEIYGYFLQFLSMFKLPRCFQLPISYQQLKNLILNLDFGNLEEIWVTICLLKSAPNLQTLEIDVPTDIVIAMDWEASDQLDCSLSHLNIVKIIDFSGTQSELEFIKFLLVNSPLLYVLHIKPKLRTDIEGFMVMQELLTFQRASPKAKIQYKGEKFR